MYQRTIIILIALFLILSSSTPSLAITNGQPDGDIHPYVGLLVFDVYIPGVGVVPLWRCSGSLIAPNVVLTAGHCTDGAVAARVWFDENVQDNLEYPYSGTTSYDGIPYTNPDFCFGCGKGFPGIDYRDVGVVVLSEPVPVEVVNTYAELPAAGLVDTLKNKTDLDLVGYGVQDQIHGGGPPEWTGLRVRLYAPSQLISGRFVHSDEFIRLTMNPGQDKGGMCYGDSGGPNLLSDTRTVLAVNCYGANRNCAGVGFSSRIDIPEVLEWIGSFLP